MFYDNFMNLCREKGQTPSSVGIAIGVQKSTVTRWKQGSYPSEPTLKKLADYFGVPVSVLTGKEEKPSTITVRDEDGELIVLDDETLEYIDSLRARPEMKMLFSVSKKATKEDIIKAVKIIEALKDESEKD